MGFDKNESEKLLAECGRRCCICGKQHRVQLHHIKPREKGGTDEIENAIPLCPNCHDEVHTEYSTGRITKQYSETELKHHRQRTIDQVKQSPTDVEATNPQIDITEEFLAQQHALIFSQFDEDTRMLTRTLRMQGRFNGTYGMNQLIAQIARYVTDFLAQIEHRAIKTHGCNVFLDQQVKEQLGKYLEADLAFLNQKLAATFPQRIRSTPMINATREGEAVIRRLYASFFLKMFSL